MYTSTLLEISQNPKICMEPKAFEGIRNQILNNISLRVGSGIEKEVRLQALAVFEDGKLVSFPQGVADFKTHEEIASLSNEIDFEGNPAVEQHASTEGHCESEDQSVPGSQTRLQGAEGGTKETKLVNIIRLTGPMTRNGDDCSYGSREHRDMLMEAADDSRVVAHIIYCHTPGGMATTLRDYRKAVNYCHSKGQKVYMYCDGDVASGGAFLACMCDGVYAFNGEDEIGSLGMYASFFTLADGAKNAISEETYHEYYAEKSPDKNKWHRKAAEGDMSVIEKGVNRDLDQLLANAQKDRPQVKEEQLTGSMFKMNTVVGSLIDGFTTLPALCNMALEEYNQRKGEALPAKEQAKAHTQSDTSMKSYEKMAAFIGNENAFESQTDGFVSLDPASADALEAACEQAMADRETLTSVQEQLATSTTQLDTVNSSLEQAQTDLAEIQQRVENMADYNTIKESLATATTQLAAAQEQLTQMTAERDQANEQLANANQRVTDLTAEVERLNAIPAGNPAGGEAPGNNGVTKVTEPTFSTSAYTYNPNLSPSENARAKKEYEANLRELAY